MIIFIIVIIIIYIIASWKCNPQYFNFYQQCWWNIKTGDVGTLQTSDTQTARLVLKNSLHQGQNNKFPFKYLEHGIPTLLDTSNLRKMSLGPFLPRLLNIYGCIFRAYAKYFVACWTTGIMNENHVLLTSQFNFLQGSDENTARLIKAVNETGKIHIGPGQFHQKKVIRFCIAAEQTTEKDIHYAWHVIQEQASGIFKRSNNKEEIGLQSAETNTPLRCVLGD